MSENSFSVSGRIESDPRTALESVAARQRQELAASLAILRARQRQERRERRHSRLIGLWPLGIGIVLGAASPVLQSLLALLHPWVMTLVFPYVVLARRPEIQTGSLLTHALPVLMLYAQFPIEGLLARIVLKRRLSVFRVTGQVLLFHFLGIAEILMLSGIGDRFLHR